MEKIKIIIADDMQEIRNLFKSVFQGNTQFDVIGEASNGIEVYEMVDKLKPDIVLMDVEMESRYSGIEATKRVTDNYPDVKVVVLTMHDDDEIFVNSYVAGAKAFLLKNSSSETIFSTISSVFYEKYTLDESGMKKVLNRLSRYASERRSLLFVMNILGTLTKTETEILRSIYVGKSYKEIVKERYIEKKTLENHITSILKKFNTKSMKHLIVELKELKIFDNLFL